MHVGCWDTIFVDHSTDKSYVVVVFVVEVGSLYVTVSYIGEGGLVGEVEAIITNDEVKSGGLKTGAKVVEGAKLGAVSENKETEDGEEWWREYGKFDSQNSTWRET